MAAATMIARPVNFVAMVFLARLLDPRDFGLVALAGILLSATYLFSGLGMGNALIHSKEPRYKVAWPALILSFLFGLLLFLIVRLNAPFFADLLGNPEATPVIQWMSVLILLDALFLVPDALLRKELMFGQVSKADVASLLVSNGVALVFAFLGFGVWSLVYGELARSLTRLVIVWVVCPGWDWIKPRRWDMGAVKGLLRYGIQSMGSGFMSYFNSNWDDWLVGRTLGPAALGFYSKAYSLTNQTIVGFNRAVISGVFFPSYAKIQDDKERLSRVYLKALGVVALVMTPLSMGLFIVAPEAVPIVLGAKWVPMVLTLQIFAFMALVRPLAGSTAPLFLAVGRPDFNMRAGLVLTVVMAPLVFLLLPQGTAGVAVAVTVSYAVGFVFNIYQVQKILPGTTMRMILAILPALFSSCAMILAVQLSKAPLAQWAGGLHNWLSLAVMITIGAAVYILTAFLVQRTLILEAIGLFMSVLKSWNRAVFHRRPIGG